MLQNQKFNRLLVLEQSDKTGCNGPYYVCLCDCGITKVVSKRAIVSGSTKSCGCLQKEKAKAVGQNMAKFPGNDTQRRVFTTYRYRAKKKGFIFELSPDAFYALIQQECHYCGASPDNEVAMPNGNTMNYNGLDRVDNLKGYVESNVVSCCKTCNLAKRILPIDEFLAAIRRIHAFQISKVGGSNI